MSLAAIRQQINIAVPARTVWNSLTTEEGLVPWLCDQARVEGRAGGRVVLTRQEQDGTATEMRGMFHEFRPTSKVEIAWDTAGNSPARGTRVAFQVARDGDETRLSLVQSGAALDDEAVRAALEERWRAALLALRGRLEKA